MRIMLVIAKLERERDGQTAECMISPGKGTRQFCVSGHLNGISAQGGNRAAGTEPLEQALKATGFQS